RARRRAHDGRARARGEARDQPPRTRRPGARPGADGGIVIRTKTGAAALSVASNSLLIVLKLIAGAVTGSIAIITEAIHSGIDLVASIVAYVSVRRADVPPD